MRPFNIEITWVDYNPTLDIDIYKVTVYDQIKQKELTSWTTSAQNLGLTIAKYMNN